MRHFGKALAAMLLLVVLSAAQAEEAPSLPVDFSPGMPIQQKNYLSEYEYEDPTLHVVIETGNKDHCDYWLARVRIGHPSQLRTAAAGGFNNDFTTQGTALARRQNAVLAIDGDYYCYYPYGMVVRQGVFYRDKLRKERDVLAIDEDGNFHIYFVPNKGEVPQEQDGKRMINIFHFGPALVVDGEIGNLEASYWIAPELKRQRMCIAQTGPLEYMALCCAGPSGEYGGMTIREFAQLAKELGAVTAYNLDGGDSTMLIFNGKKVNFVDSTSTRLISDIIYFASAWDGQ